ncbi:MAG: hypothetical protein WD229_02515 [Pirellulales bacterium]
MRTSLTRTLIAVGALVCTTPVLAAGDLGFSDPDPQLSGTSQNESAVPGVQQLAYLSEIEANEEQLPPGVAPMPEQMYGPVTGYGEGGYCEPCYQPDAGMYYAEAQVMFLRAHVLEESLGKLSEKYEFTPRLILGYESPSGLGGRVRYWTYGRTTPNLDDPDDDLRLEFDVIDFEGTSRFRTTHTELVVAGGFRWAHIDTELDDESVDSNMPGITFAGDLRSTLCRGCRSQWSGICGARWSLLGGDWEGDANGYIEPTRDDNVVVQEIYGGFEYLCHYSNYDLFARIIFEVQNWRSDALGESADTDSIGFIGPSVHVGAAF